MANTLKKLAQLQLTTADQEIYVSPAGKTTTLTAVFVANVDNSSKTFRLNMVDSGDSSDVTNQVFPDVSINANTVVEFGRGTVLEAGQSLRGLASANTSVVVTAFGIQTDV